MPRLYMYKQYKSWSGIQCHKTKTLYNACMHGNCIHVLQDSHTRFTYTYMYMYIYYSVMSQSSAATSGASNSAPPAPSGKRYHYIHVHVCRKLGRGTLSFMVYACLWMSRVENLQVATYMYMYMYWESTPTLPTLTRYTQEHRTSSLEGQIKDLLYITCQLSPVHVQMYICTYMYRCGTCIYTCRSLHQ